MSPNGWSKKIKLLKVVVSPYVIALTTKHIVLEEKNTLNSGSESKVKFMYCVIPLTV